MSTLARTRSNAVSVESPLAPTQVGWKLDVTWLVSRSAACAALASTRPEITVEPSPHSDSLRIVWRVRVETGASGTQMAHAQAILEDPSRGTTTNLTGELQGVAICDSAGSDELVHIEVPGSLVCTSRAGRTLYANSPLLAALGLEGGRYDVVG